MKKFYCNGKKGFCERKECSDETCVFYEGSGGVFLEVNEGIVAGHRPKIKVVLDPGATMPTRAHETDAGLDLYAKNNAVIRPGEWAQFDTGVHVEIPANYVGLVTSKSGLMAKEGLTSRGTIDSGYIGSIRVVLFNHGKKSVTIKKGQKISQLVILPIITPEPILVDKLDDTDRGGGGFGSTGKF